VGEDDGEVAGVWTEPRGGAECCGDAMARGQRDRVCEKGQALEELHGSVAAGDGDLCAGEAVVEGSECGGGHGGVAEPVWQEGEDFAGIVHGGIVAEKLGRGEMGLGK